MKNRVQMALETLSTIIVAGVAVTMLVVFLRDRSGPPLTDDPAQLTVEDWEEWAPAANRIGPEGAPVVISAFMDFTCPFCRDLVPILDSLMTEFPERVAVDFHHFPLPGHSFTFESAVAAECAGDQGAFGPMYRTLFSQMDSIGSKDWTAFAEESGVPDLAAFEDCIGDPLEDFGRILASRALGDSIGVTGTPKIWINGRLFRGNRTLQGLRDSVRRWGR